MKTTSIVIAALGTLALASCVTPVDDATATVTTTSTTYQPGYRVTTLPRGYTTQTIGGAQYYTHQDVYYQPSSSGYVVVQRPDLVGVDHRGHNHVGPVGQQYAVGNIVTTLPSGYTTVRRRGTDYYSYGNTYFRRHGNGYIVVDY